MVWVADPLSFAVCVFWQAASERQIHQHVCGVHGMHESRGGCRLVRGRHCTFVCAHTFVAASDMRPAGAHNRPIRAGASGIAQGCHLVQPGYALGYGGSSCQPDRTWEVTSGQVRQVHRQI